MLILFHIPIHIHIPIPNLLLILLPTPIPIPNLLPIVLPIVLLLLIVLPNSPFSSTHPQYLFAPQYLILLIFVLSLALYCQKSK